MHIIILTLFLIEGLRKTVETKPIGPQEPVKIAPPPVQPAPFATAFAATAQVKSAQPEVG